jgi:hypothetical protein
VLQPPIASAFLTWSFTVFGVVLAAGFVWIGHIAGRRARLSPATNRRLTTVAMLATIAWLGGTWLAASSGVLSQFDRRPPPFALLVLAIVSVSIGVTWGPLGVRLLRGVPLWVLVLTQAFRCPLELVMHEAAVEGIMPVQMSYSGRNFDIVSGLTALPAALLLATGVGGRQLAIAWNILGSLLLVNIVTIAVLSTPTFALFGPERLNTWVAYAPFVWLPAVMVTCALIGHLLIWRRLLTPTTTPHL